jgi:5-methyltetrahydropteroyltriglutamate--homocysteine methyltransferase
VQRSDQHLLTTHTGSLPRPSDLAEMMLARDEGQPIDAADLEARVEAAVREVVERQRDTGIDVLNDGEMSKPSYSTYVKDRLSGFEGKGRRPTGGTQEAVDFPGFVRATDPSQSRLQFPVCTGPVAVADRYAVERDIARVRAATASGDAARDVFMTSVSPGQIARFMPNAFYPSHEAYIWALADAMQPEYEAIVGAGLVLQVDCPDLASGRTNSEFASLPLDEWRAIAQMHVQALNHALRRIPPESVRLHLCWGNYAGPHQRDVPLADIVDIALSAHVGGLSFEAANPRHAHEWVVFRDRKLPDGLVLLPGVIESCSPYIEHPDLVAQRLERFVAVAGFENVIAATDCGFGTFVGSAAIHPGIVWAKLRSLVEGARLVRRDA